MIGYQSSRRTFLKGASAAAASGLLSQLSPTRLMALVPGQVPPEPDETLLRQLALEAMDAARAAGASFADVRVGAGRMLKVGAYYSPAEGSAPVLDAPDFRTGVGYGVRAIVDGVWGFATGYELTPDAVARAARTAVSMARASQRRGERRLELAPVPRVDDGRWATPIVQDPFTVPLREQSALAFDAVASAAALRAIARAYCTFQWLCTTRVFASSEGSLMVQRLALARPSAGAFVRDEYLGLRGATIDTFRSGGYGYEALAADSLVAALRQAAERAIAGAPQNHRPKAADVGRYDIVCGPAAVVSLLGSLTSALDLERVLGYRANRDGTSFLPPPGDNPDPYQVASTLLTVRADRSRPHGAATVGWDEEGVAPEAYTYIRGGFAVDYHTNRQTAAAIAPWYERRGEPVRSHGCAVGAGQALPTVQLPNVTMQPGPGNATLEDLIADTARGFYVEVASGSLDQQLLTGQFVGQAREITRGKLGAPVTDFAFQFVLPQLWKSLDALGGVGSSAQSVKRGDPRLGMIGDPLQIPWSTISVVPARFRQVNVLNVGRPA